MADKVRKQRTPAPPTLKRVNAELWLLFKQARAGELDVCDASRLASILNILMTGIKSGDLETRINELEAVAKGNRR